MLQTVVYMIRYKNIFLWAFVSMITVQKTGSMISWDDVTLIANAFDSALPNWNAANYAWAFQAEM